VIPRRFQRPDKQLHTALGVLCMVLCEAQRQQIDPWDLYPELFMWAEHILESAAKEDLQACKEVLQRIDPSFRLGFEGDDGEDL
jgi:hypothetical protein